MVTQILSKTIKKLLASQKHHESYRKHHYYHLHFHRHKHEHECKKNPKEKPHAPYVLFPEDPTSAVTNNFDLVKKAICVTFFAISEVLPFLETDSNGIFHHVFKSFFGDTDPPEKTEENH